MKEIQLTKGMVALVDDEDYDRLLKHKWYFGSHGYAVRDTGGRKNRRAVLMHNEIICPLPTFVIDHLNREKLDNRKCNLRACTKSQNSFNSFRKDNASGYRGVSWCRITNKWVTRKSVRGVYKVIGYFTTAEDANDAYKAVSIQYD